MLPQEQKLAQTKRLEYIDIAKGIGILLVVVFHCKIGDASHLHNYVYSFHMPLFFLLAGLCFSTRYNFKDFVTKRTQRLLVPCFFFVIIHVTVGCVVHYQNPYDAVLSKLPMHIPGALWFLPVLFISEMLCFPLICKMGRSSRVIGLVIFGLTGGGIMAMSLPIPQSLGTVPLSSFFVLVGYELKGVVNKSLTPSRAKFFTLLITWLVITKVAKVNVAFYDNISTPFLISEVSSLLGIYLCMIVSVKLVGTRVGGVLADIGIVSLQIMLIHQLFSVSTAALLWNPDGTLPNKLIFMAFQLTLTFAGTYYSVKFIDTKAKWLIGKW